MNLGESTTSRDYFLMPIPPTPNGRLHLGHMAGPYLRMDMLARYLRREGHRALVISAIDGYDSYVLWKAAQESRTPEDVCHHYRRLIEEDFAALDIDMAGFLDLVQGPDADVHASRTRAAVAQLCRKGLVATRVERVLYAAATDRYIVGAWLLGTCPYCHRDAAGYFCEACGAHFQPEAIGGPRARLDDDPVEWRPVESIFLRIPDVDVLVEHNAAAGASEHVQAVVRRYLNHEGPQFRLTAPGRWGVPWSSDRWGNPRVLFQAGWEALACGDRYAAILGHDQHPLQAGSPVTAVLSFGIDNTIPLLVGCTGGMLGLDDYRPFDHVLTNYFYALEGAKFSTSRGHVIWTTDIVTKTPARSDAVRYFLAQHNPEHGPESLDVPHFVSVVNRALVEGVQATMREALAAVSDVTPHAVTDRAVQALEAALDHQARAFSLDAMSLAQAARVIDDWVAIRPSIVSAPWQDYWWLTGLAWLALPIMPRLSASLWQALGHDHPPARAGLFEPRHTRVWREGPPFERLSTTALLPCLPHDLQPASV